MSPGSTSSGALGSTPLTAVVVWGALVTAVVVWGAVVEPEQAAVPKMSDSAKVVNVIAGLVGMCSTIRNGGQAETPIKVSDQPERCDRHSGPRSCRYRYTVAGERILVVEDDKRIGSTLLRALEGNGYVAAWCQTGAAALESLVDRPDLVLLDLGLPDIDGLELCRQIRTLDGTIEIIILTARDEELDIVIGLDAGAVDYITKPFRLAELSARVRAQLRRNETASFIRTAVGDLTVDLGARRVFIAGAEVELRVKEFDLLARLLADAGQAVTREALMADVWDTNWFGSTKTLDFHISALRRKIDLPGRESRVTTLRGVGYRYELP